MDREEEQGIRGRLDQRAYQGRMALREEQEIPVYQALMAHLAFEEQREQWANKVKMDRQAVRDREDQRVIMVLKARLGHREEQEELGVVVNEARWVSEVYKDLWE